MYYEGPEARTPSQAPMSGYSELGGYGPIPSQLQQISQTQQQRNTQQQPFRIPYSEPLQDPFLSSLDPDKYQNGSPSVTSLRDRFRVTSAIAFSILFHWGVIYSISFLSNLLNFGIVRFKPEITPSLVWHTAIISVCVGSIAVLHFMQIQWSKPYSSDEITKHVAVYFKISTIWYFTSYLLLGLFLTTAYQGLYNGGYTKKLECFGTEGCVNDKYLFILFSSWFSLGKAFVNFRRSRQYRIEFPDITQSIHGRIRHFCSIYFVESSKQVLRNLPLAYFIYYFMGATFRIWASQSASLNLGVNLLQTFSQFLSVELFLYALLTSTFTVGTFTVCWEFLYLCLTKRRVFPLDVDPLLDMGDGAGSVLLTDALRAPETDYMRVLAFYDVFCMTDKAERRVQDLFKVGYKGGRTLLWTTILEECLKPLQNTSNVIKSFVKQEQAAQKQNLSSTTAKKSTSSPQTPSAIVTLLPDCDHDHGSTATNSLNVRRRGVYPMRPLETPPTQKVERILGPLTPVQILMRGTFRTDKATAALSALARNFRWTGFYFNMKLEAQVSLVLADTQVLIMSLRTLMNVVNLYVKESYADVVQRDLASIIITLTETHEAITLLSKLEKRHDISSTLIIGDPKSQTIVGSNVTLARTQAYLSTNLTNALLELDYRFRPYLEFMPISFDLRTKLKNIVSNHNFLAESYSRSSK